MWGSTVEKRRQHLIGWESVCRPKSDGGLRIRKASQMNKALIAKVGWRVFNDETSLWARVLRSKYKIGHIHDSNWVKARGTWSSTWRSVIVGIKDVICLGHGWVVGDGQRINFWTDKWLMGEALIDKTVVDVLEGILNAKAGDMWIDGVGWDLQNIVPYVSEDTRLELAAVVVDKVPSVKDRLSWTEMADGSFTVSSAYRLLTRDITPRPFMGQFFDSIWSVIAPERTRVFL